MRRGARRRGRAARRREGRRGRRPRHGGRPGRRRARRGGREGRRRRGRRRRADREGRSRACAASPTSTRSSSRWCSAPALIVARQGRRGPARGRDLRGQPLGAVRGQRALSPGRLEAAVRRARWMRRLDHTMIFFLIAGTVTPFALLRHGAAPLSTALLIAVWAGAVAGTIVELVWIDVAEVGLGDRLRRRRPDRRDRLPGDRRRGGPRRRAADRRRRRALRRPAPSSTRSSAPTRARPCSATTRSSTCW